ncbi:hypothetical protein [Streptomyces chrestomyceticus]|uniref:hypothetical protein n=1 Tax=Streptomyces chrestomyceticus TaxID=68185 RepID=UPI0037B126C5
MASDDMGNAAGGQTVVLITHCLHSVRSADPIYLMEDGRAVESGAITELMDSATVADGRFRAMYEIQRARFVPDDDEQPVPLQRGPTVT